jgi:type IV secretion system protein TrbB
MEDSATVTRISARDEHKRRIREKLTRELGPQIIGLLNDPTVIEIMLNPDGTLWVEHLGEDMVQFGRMAAPQAESLMGTVAATLRTELTAHNPILECELPLDGSRFEALIPPVVAGPTFSIRKRAIRVFSLDDYIAQGIMTTAQADAIIRAVRERKNILVVGGTGSGKTTLVNAIIAYKVLVAPGRRLIIIEDTSELQCEAENAVLIRVVDYVDMTRAVKAVLRLRPDEIIVGEVRDGAALALLKGWNTGHPGGVATVHANSARAGLIRMEQLVAEATQAPMAKLIAETIDVIVAIAKVATTRRVTEIVRVVGHDGTDYITTPVEE